MGQLCVFRNLCLVLSFPKPGGGHGLLSLEVDSWSITIGSRHIDALWQFHIGVGLFWENPTRVLLILVDFNAIPIQTSFDVLGVSVACFLSAVLVNWNTGQVIGISCAPVVSSKEIHTATLELSKIDVVRDAFHVLMLGCSKLTLIYRTWQMAIGRNTKIWITIMEPNDWTKFM